MPFLVQLQFTSASALWLMASLALGVLYALVLYGASKSLNKSLRRALFALRTFVVATLAFLLFAPLLRTVDRTTEKPLIIIAQDNSLSLTLSRSPGFNERSYLSGLKSLENKLSDDYDVRSIHFSSDVKEGLNLDFQGSLTNISAVFNFISTQFANRNIGAIILGTDGIYNRGANPQYESRQIKASVYTVALGDTLAKRDLLISNVNYNGVAFLDNRFEVEVSIEAFQAQGASSILSVSDASGVVYSRPVSIASGEFRVTLPLTLLARQKGIQPYTIRLSPITNELSTRNNSQTIFVEVIDGSQKVLILANSPHPDLAALRQAISKSKNYDVQVLFPSEASQEAIRQAGLVILHQLPSVSNDATDLIKAALNKPVWFILGAQSNLNSFSLVQPVLTISPSGNMQEAVANINPSFYGFTLTELNKNRIQNFTPLMSPFGNYSLKGQADVALRQQIGKVVSNTPLLVFGENTGRKIGILAAEGFWRWRLEDFQENSNHEASDELILKTVQYLSSREDLSKFRVYPAKNTFDESERIILNAELFNDAQELVNSPDVNITLKSNSGRTYSYVFTRAGSSYTLDAGILPAGEYSYVANTALGKVKHTARGRFIITQQQAEYRQTQANHQLLYAMSKQSGGEMIYPDQLDKLAELIKANETIKTVAYENPTYKELIDLKLIFFVIIGLLSLEWFIRKRNGEI